MYPKQTLPYHYDDDALLSIAWGKKREKPTVSNKNQGNGFLERSQGS